VERWICHIYTIGIGGKLLHSGIARAYYRANSAARIAATQIFNGAFKLRHGSVYESRNPSRRTLEFFFGERGKSKYGSVTT
jgi:hypothetical protein